MRIMVSGSRCPIYFYLVSWCWGDAAAAPERPMTYYYTKSDFVFSSKCILGAYECHFEPERLELEMFDFEVELVSGALTG